MSDQRCPGWHLKWWRSKVTFTLTLLDRTLYSVFICLCDLWKARAPCENYQNPGSKNTKYSQFSKSGRFPGKAGLPRRIVAPRSLESRRSLCHRPRRRAERSKFNQTTIPTFVREEKLRKSISRQKPARYKSLPGNRECRRRISGDGRRDIATSRSEYTRRAFTQLEDWVL